MREAELWARMGAHLGDGYVRAWADQQVIEGLGSRTVREALTAGVPCKAIWREVWRFLELPASQR